LKIKSFCSAGFELSMLSFNVISLAGLADEITTATISTKIV
jgi:hypothetical protein